MAITWGCSVEYFDEAGNSLGQRISTSQNTVARFAFTDLGGGTPDPTLYSFICHIQEDEAIGENNYFAAFSEYAGWQDQQGNYFAPVQGESGLKIEVVGSTIFVSVLILADRLPVGYVPRTSCRIIIKEFTVVTLFRYLDLEFREGANGYESYWQQPEQMLSPVLTAAFFENTEAQFIYKFNAVDPLSDSVTYPNGWDDVQATTSVLWLAEMAAQSNYHFYAKTDAANYIDTGLQIQYQSTGTVINNNVNLPEDCIDLDSVIYLTRKVEITSVTDINGNVGIYFFSLRLDSPNVEDYNLFDYTNFNDLNTAIAALAEDTKYAIHVYSMKNINDASELDIEYTFLTDPTESKSIHVGPRNETRFFNNGNGVDPEINQCLRFGTNGDYEPSPGLNFAISQNLPNQDTALIDLFDYSLNNPFTVVWWGRVRDENDPQISIANSAIGIITPTDNAAGVLSGFYFVVDSQNMNFMEMRFQQTTSLTKEVRFDLSGFAANLPWNSLVMCAASYDGSGLISGMDLYFNGIKASGTYRTEPADDGIGATRPNQQRYQHGRINDGPPLSGTNPQCTERIQIFDAKLSDTDLRRLFNNPNYYRDLGGAPLFRDLYFGADNFDAGNGVSRGIEDLENGEHWLLGWQAGTVPRNDFYEDLN
jgi:hypothetical protein